MTTLLIDGDELLYTATSAVEREVRWDDVNHVLYSNADEADTLIYRKLKTLIRELQANEYYLMFTGKDNFRYKVSPDYKSHRVDKRKPLCFGYLIDKLFQQEPCIIEDTLEADDLMGIHQTSGRYRKPIIVSEDKDMLTIPGWHYRNGALLHNPEADADFNWMFQTLTGDTADGYPGCPGVGKVGAMKALENSSDLWKTVVSLFLKAGKTREDALVQARLARILRASDWNEEKREVVLWEPKG